MTRNPEISQWQAANTRDLSARLGRIHAWLSLALGLPAEVKEIPPAEDILTTAPILSGVFNLTDFETNLLLLCAGVEMDSAIAALCAEMNGDPRRFSPTFGMALTVLPGAHWSALAPGSPLRYWRLLDIAPGDTLAHAPLRIDERILHFLAGMSGFDSRLEVIIHPASEQPREQLPSPPVSADYSQEIARLAGLLSSKEIPVIHLYGGDYDSRVSLAKSAVEKLGLRLFTLRAGDIPHNPEERHLIARLWQREALLTNGLLLVETSGDAQELSAFSVFVADERISLILTSDLPVHISSHRHIVRFQLNRPGAAAQQEAWQHALAAHGISANGFAPQLTAQFQMPLTLIRAAVEDALSGLEQAALPGEQVLTILTPEVKRRLWEACRRQGRPNLDDLAQRIETRHVWKDIVLPERQLEMLHGIVAQVAQRQKVYETWGFGVHTRGTGTSVIFAGASGTGKTLAAEIIANELNLDLYRVDLSGVVSKYIGETEKNLRRIFAAAEYGGSILLFDEADALFGKRSEVKDSHDRYANIEVSYLLQQMEQYRGLAILTTNMLENFDRAFLRRVRFIVQFPFPTAEQRAEIWARVFPPEAPTVGLDLIKLSRLGITGGHIRNIALNGAFLAANAGESIRMGHLLGAAKFEFNKLEKPLPDTEVSDWEKADE